MEWLWKEAFVAYFKVFSHHLPEDIEKNETFL